MSEVPLSSPVAMILAAGFGTRMAPLSRTMPKALLPVLGRPLLEWVLRHLAVQGVTQAVVNCHHLPEPLAAWAEENAGGSFNLGDEERLLPQIRIVREPVILGTGGGIANAAPLLTTDPVLVHNVDLLLRFDLPALLAAHHRTNALATLVLVREPEYAQIEVEGARVTRIASRPDPSSRDRWCFSGVSLFSQEAIRELPRGGFEELTPHLRRWARAERLGASFEAAPFREVGTLESYLEVHRELSGEIDLGRFLAGEPPANLRRPGPRSVFDGSSVIPAGTVITDSVGLAGVVVSEGSRIDRAVLGAGSQPRAELDRTAHAAGEERSLALLSAHEETSCRAFLDEHPIPEVPKNEREPPRLRLLHGDGSSRLIVRVSQGGATAIAMIHPPRPAPANYPRRTEPGAPDENETFCYVAEHLDSLGVRVPRVHAFERAAGIVLVEDLGSTRLFDLVRTGTPKEMEDAYLEAIEVLLRIQRPGPEAFDPARTFNVEYDEEFVRAYEVDYFQREMVQGWAGLTAPTAGLRAEYDEIAQRAGRAGARVLMHRDFQSRNLMVTRKAMAVLDFQGARPGPPSYDLAAILYDPYVELAHLREKLFERYLQLSGRGSDFRDSFVTVALARLLQTLGAFGYLGGRLGKPGFLEHAPRALASLVELSAPRYPELARLAESIGSSLDES